MIVLPGGTIQYMRYSEARGIEEHLPDFLLDVATNIRTGMTLPQAVKTSAKSSFGPLTPYARRIAAQVDWGIPFEKSLMGFAEGKSKNIRRTVTTIIESHRSGGSIAEIMESIARSTTEIEKIRKERASQIYAQMTTGYIIFFIFLGIMIALQTMLIPDLTSLTAPMGDSDTEALLATYRQLFFWLIMIQGAFSGIAIGKMAEGALEAGIKHSIILVLLGYTAFLIFM
jgi:flagellar protein FlaJ